MILLSLMFFITGASASWQTYLDQEVIKGHLEEFYTDAQYLKLPWRPSSEVAFEKPPRDPSQLHPTALSCRSQKLWPTHPQQSTKEYLHAVVAMYDQDRLPATSPACLITTTTRRWCLRTTWANLFVLSDTYTDDCGNLYRGYWFVSYLESNDNMGTLLSKGRTVYPRPGSEFPNDLEEGGTYEVQAKDFMFLTPLDSGDAAKINQSKDAALARRYRMQGRAFIVK